MASANIDFETIVRSLTGLRLVVRADAPKFTVLYENRVQTDNSLASVQAVIGRRALVKSFQAVIRSGKPDAPPAFRSDLPNKRGIATEHWWRVTHYPIFDPGHTKVIQICQVLVDISERRKTESENRQLKALNDAKDDFITLASHQLRTPATAVKQYLGILIEEYAGPVSPDQLQYLNIANDANERQLRIINDLLKTAQIDVKGYRLKPVSLDLNRLLDNVIAGCRLTADVKEQTIHFDRPAEPLMVTVDKAEIAIVFNNLVENASKYSANGKTITVQCRQAKNMAEVTVKDEGVGIAKKNQRLIFDKFTRIANPLSDTVTGSGLGLYWVKRIVELHGGKLALTSAVGKGTTFTVTLPL